MTNGLDERSKIDFLVYANSVIKSRAIPSVEDNLKPIHRKILYTLWEDKVTPDKPTKKCATEAGRALAYSPHGDASVYGAMVRMSQWWKLRYPLIEMQGNCGNLLGDGPAAARYTECRLSPIGMMMLEDLNKNCVDFKPNYDESTVEPVTLPSKFPYLLCGNNSGIAVGMSSDLVSHNFTEVMNAINYYMKHKDTCSVADLMQFIQGPDFPTGGFIPHGEDLLNIYTTGRGSIKVYAHYKVLKKGQKNVIVFKDLPYGVEIESGVKAPLKKLILEDGYDVFEDIDIRKAGPRSFDISITLAKNANVNNCLDILFTKTRLCDSIKINQTVIVNGEPKVLNLKDLIAYWVSYRSDIISKIAKTNYDKTQHKLTVTLGLQKCLSNIDKLIDLIRNADSRSDAKIALMKEFVLNDEQAEAVLDMKLSRLSHLDVKELNDTEKELEKTLAQLKNIINNEDERYAIISKDLADIKAVLGKDERLTEIAYQRPVEGIESTETLIEKEWQIYSDGLHGSMDGTNAVQNNLTDVVFAYQPEDIMVYNKQGEMGAINEIGAENGIIGAFNKNGNKNKIVAVTKNGNIKVTLMSEYKMKKREKVMKLKDNDELVFVSAVDDNDSIIVFNGEQNVLRLAIKDLATVGKLTLGVKTGFANITAAAVVTDSSMLLFVTNENKAKLTSAKDFVIGNRGNAGQLVVEGTKFMRVFEEARECIYVIPKQGAVLKVGREKISIKSRTAVGASLTSRNIISVI